MRHITDDACRCLFVLNQVFDGIETGHFFKDLTGVIHSAKRYYK